MNYDEVSAFSVNGRGGNPAGVAIRDAFPNDTEMQTLAASIGHSETAFAVVDGRHARVRYFAPESEVPFCGHATIALGSVLGERFGAGIFELTTNVGDISVETSLRGGELEIALQSPPTFSRPLSDDELTETLVQFGYSDDDLNMSIPPAKIHGGAEHFVIALRDRSALSAMDYDLRAGQEFMRAHGLVTVMFVVAEGVQQFHARNAFASGGVFEDPATGAAAAAFAGYLRDIHWPHAGIIQITQGEDMGRKSHITARIGVLAGESIRVSGRAHRM